MRPLHYILYAFSALFVASCDSGDIAEKVFTVDETGYTLKVTAQMSGLDEWEGSGYTLAVAGFSADSKFALLQRQFPSPSGGAWEGAIILSNLSGELQTVELALTNSLRKRIITLATVNMADYAQNGTHDTIRLDLGHVDVGRLGVLQRGLFDRACIQCHGGNGRSAAGLNLTEGNAEANLVDVASTRREGFMRVESGNAEGSLLHLILSKGGENLLTHNHTEILSSQFRSNYEDLSALIDAWIENIPR